MARVSCAAVDGVVVAGDEGAAVTAGAGLTGEGLPELGRFESCLPGVTCT